MASQSSVTSSGPFTITVSNVPLRFIRSSVFGLHRLTCPRQRCFAAQPKGPVSDRFPGPAPWRRRYHGHKSRRLSAIGISFLGILSRRGIPPLLRSAYQNLEKPWTPTRFPRSTHTRYDRSGRPLYPEASGVHTTDLWSRSPLAASPNGQALSPRCSTRLPELVLTGHHQGFIHIRPSGLPLARSFPRTEQGPLGFYPELRTPSKQDLPTHVEAGADLEH
jgi:hypothetical protein